MGSVTARGLQLAMDASQCLIELESQLDDVVVEQLMALLSQLNLTR